jgi:hypothetical protein
VFEGSVRSPTWVCIESSISALRGNPGVDGEADGWLLEEDGERVHCGWRGRGVTRKGQEAKRKRSTFYFLQS